MGTQGREHGKLCTAEEFSEYCPLFRRTCKEADVISGPEEARMFARGKGDAYQWFCLELGMKPDQAGWIKFIRNEALKIRDMLDGNTIDKELLHG